MTKAVSALRNILMHLFEVQTNAWFTKEERWKPSCQALKTFDAIHTEGLAITFPEIEYLFKEPELVLNFAERGQVLYLPPIKKEPSFVPVLSLSCKLNETQSRARFRVMLICLDEDEEVRGIGFRLETPEGQNQDEETPADEEVLANEETLADEDTSANKGIHDFYHAQLIKTFGQRKLDEKLQINYPSWLPESQPSFPLPAKCPVTMLLCLIVTLYGRTYYNDFFNIYVNDYRKSDVEQYKDEMDPWINCTSIQQVSTQPPLLNR